MNQRLMRERIAFEDLIRNESAEVSPSLSWSDRVSFARLLMRHAKTHARIQEMVCNGVEWSQYDTNETFNKRQASHEKWTEKRDQQLERRITEICASLGEGFKPVFSGDPRGCTVKIAVPSGKTNDMGREGICIPTE